MSMYFDTNYWLLGEGAAEEAKRWMEKDDNKRIIYSSPQAVQLYECGNYLSPQLPIPPKPFIIVAISASDATQDELHLGVSHWGGDGGWIESKGGDA